MSPTATNLRTIREAVGKNVRRLRTARGLTADELAHRCQIRGLRWDSTVVGRLERGHKAVQVAELLVLAHVLSSDTEPATVADLFAGTEPVEVTDRTTIDAEALRAAFTGTPVKLRVSWGKVGDILRPAGERLDEAIKTYAPNLDLDQLKAAGRAGEAERKAAQTLGVSPTTVTVIAADIWGESLTARRDRMAGPDASAQKRGRVTRGLLDELRARVERAHGEPAPTTAAQQHPGESIWGADEHDEGADRGDD